MTTTNEQRVEWRKLAEEGTQPPKSSSPSVIRNWNNIQTFLRVIALPLLDDVAQLQARLTAAEVNNGRLKEALQKIASRGFCENTKPYAFGHAPEWIGCEQYRNEPDEWCHACTAFAALTPVTEPKAAQAGEREQLAEALIEWASREYIYFRPDSNTPNTCLFCEVSLEDEEEIHAPDCLHLRAKALRASRAHE